MNIYDQLLGVRDDLQRQGANTKTMRMVDTMIDRARSQSESAISFSRLQVLRRLMSMPEALNDEDVRLDLIGLEGDLEDAAARRGEQKPAYEPERQPKLKKYYKKK